jgi:cytochrome c peroxidase
MLAALLSGVPAAAQAACPGYTACPVVNYAHIMAHDPAARAIVAGVDQTEAATVQALGGNSLSFGQLVALLGQALAFDKSLSANRAEACAECHWPKAGFAGGVGAFARAGGIFPGANPNRAGLRTPQSLAYSGFAPALTYRGATDDFVGGNFWDSRATGAITGSPAADQAAVPLTNAFEMALADPACAVRRVSRAPYGTVFGKVWGANTFAITWPADTEAVCAKLNAGGADQTPLALTPADRERAALTIHQIGLTMDAWEISSLVSPFSAKFDQVQAGTATFTKLEQRGYALFTGRAHCAACHTAAGTKPLFTAFTSANIGVPRNAADPYLTENAPSADGYIANPTGPAFIDEGLGGFLASSADTNPQWQAQAAAFMGAFQVPTLRNAALRAKSYMHNGYFTNLQTVVHFLNTRDVLPVCTGSTGIGVTCWPAPEQPLNVERLLTGHLGLIPAEETALVAFMKTLSDAPSE